MKERHTVLFTYNVTYRTAHLLDANRIHWGAFIDLLDKTASDYAVGSRFSGFVLASTGAVKNFTTLRSCMAFKKEGKMVNVIESRHFYYTIILSFANCLSIDFRGLDEIVEKSQLYFGNMGGVVTHLDVNYDCDIVDDVEDTLK